MLGETFLPKPGVVDKPHLMVVISDESPKGFLIVFFNTHKPGRTEAACLVDPGQHPFVTRRTSVNYDLARMVTRSSIESLLDKGLISPTTPVVSKLLDRIHLGAKVSKLLAPQYKALLEEQGHVDIDWPI